MDIQDVKKKVENAKVELARSEERLKQAEEKLNEVLAEIKETGFTPDKLPEVIKKLGVELEKEGKKIEEQMEIANKALDNTDVDPFDSI